jgi:hypothetical protein
MRKGLRSQYFIVEECPCLREKSLPYFVTKEANMLVKRTTKNQWTLPKAIVEATGAVDYYDVNVDNGRIILTPLRIQRADAVREKLAQLGITSNDVKVAIAWARKK